MLMLEDPEAVAQAQQIADLQGYSILACGIGSLAQALGGDRAAAEAGTQKVLEAAKRAKLADMLTANTQDVAQRVREGFLALLCRDRPRTRRSRSAARRQGVRPICYFLSSLNASSRTGSSVCMRPSAGRCGVRPASKAARDQPVEDPRPIGSGPRANDDVHGHIPRRAFAADRRRRLMIAEQDQDAIAVRGRAQVAAERRVGVGHRRRRSPAERRPVGLLRVRVHDRRPVVGSIGQHARPVGLIRRRRAERKVRADGRKEDEQRRPATAGRARASRTAPAKTDREWRTSRTRALDSRAAPRRRCRRIRRTRLPATVAAAPASARPCDSRAARTRSPACRASASSGSRCSPRRGLRRPTSGSGARATRSRRRSATRRTPTRRRDGCRGWPRRVRRGSRPGAARYPAARS